MRRIWLLAALSATPAGAQLSGLAAPVQGIVSGSASAASRGGAGAIDPSLGSRDPTPSIVGGARGRPAVRVQAGARVRATRETRCTDGADSYDPIYGPDGGYHCESRGPGVAAGARVKAGG